MIKNTNSYSRQNVESWEDINDNDFQDFISMLNSVAIQKCHDGLYQWFSTNPVLGNPCIRRIMEKFLWILNVLSISSIDLPRGHKTGYTPSMKVEEFKVALEHRFWVLYKPGRNLSVDETLPHTYGRIGFKVRVVTKATQLSIKMYVCSDPHDEYVLSTSMYVGDDKKEGINPKLGKTTQVAL